ncbi:MAG: M20/M25/M40 family metallo-hydrolase [Candidatus Pseudobacter hemicellulosilyticus]|uniref:M20/M25/M40 family metallo-hydrolase n=1 Tax=Candidatus Pseudobacter hemicellulosilyticus TaxID=3121375 RepID=A0AAJ5WZM1_9BACT|nr:MAG: M20/M25/M40 family metallo-hydrolase [Pseudobacter sp.]
MFKKYISIFTLAFLAQACFAQNIDKLINQGEVERIERTLSADDMQGRKTFTPGIDKAAEFIAAEFKKAGIQPLKDNSWFQEFFMLKTKFESAKGELNGQSLNERDIVGLTSKEELSVTQSSGYEYVKIGKGENLYEKVMAMVETSKNYFVTVDTSFGRMFNSLKRFRQNAFPSDANILLVLSNETAATTYNISFKQTVTKDPLKNVVGVLPGKKKKDEYVIFSGHYDHLGIGKPNAEGDSIYNGANDDAAGITAVIMLAKYFAEKKDNARTLVFAAFTAEEIGGFGSQYFSKQFDPAKVMAMFNIEMIGTDSKWGTNSAYITGYEKTDMGKILEKNLEGSAFKFYPDPYPDQQLFYRSDNATLARLGVPAHTISTSKMDSEKHYHTLGDEIETLDLKNMTEIIKAIAISSASIVAGKDTPARVDAKQLR